MAVSSHAVTSFGYGQRMTKGMRYGLAALCVAALAGLAMLVVASGDDTTPGESLAGSLAAAVFLLAGAGGLVTVGVSLVRGPR